MNKLVVSNVIACAILATTVCAQDTGGTTAAAPTVGLKDAYAGKFLIGCAADLPGRSSAAELASVKLNYNVVTPENCMKPQPTHPTEANYNFNQPDALVKWCSENNIKVWGHTLLWHSQTANWFFQGTNGQGGASRELALERLSNHIATVVGRYKGKIIGWDVCNESINDGGNGQTENLRGQGWYRTVGPDVINYAFKFAHQADPDAQLYYNDYNIEQGSVRNTGKHASSLLLLKRLIKDGVPINGVGIQGHWHLNTNIEDVEKAIENYEALGLKISISELDVTSTGGNSGALGRQGGGAISPENVQKQAEVFGKLFEIFNRHAKSISRVTLWGLSDTRSWRNGQGALLHDGQLNPKPSYHAVMNVGLGKVTAPEPKVNLP
jgi:endo-1,4-beta-xylanase